ncbi:MAG: hypothetical protein ACOC1F_00240 [Myxococcota bacterium]
MHVFHERRSQRSDSRREALSLQLRASARRAQVEAMVLADHSGRVIARSDRDGVADELASFSPFLAKPTTWFGLVHFGGQPRPVAISPFRLGSQTAYLCALGAQRKNLGGVILQTTAGVRRIMRT